MNWKSQHREIQIFEDTISYIDSEKGNDVLLILHGYASCSFEYHKIIDELQTDYRLIIPNLIGFGYSSKPKSYYSMLDHASILVQLMRYLNVKKVSILGQGLGTCIAEEIYNITDLGYIDLEIDRLYLSNFSLPFDLLENQNDIDALNQSLTAKFLKVTLSYHHFKNYMNQLFFNTEHILEDDMMLLWEGLNAEQGLRTLDHIDNFLLELSRNRNRRLRNLKGMTSKIHLIYGNNNVDFNNESHFNRIGDYFELKSENIHLIENCGQWVAFEKPERFIEVFKKNQDKLVA